MPNHGFWTDANNIGQIQMKQTIIITYVAGQIFLKSQYNLFQPRNFSFSFIISLNMIALVS